MQSDDAKHRSRSVLAWSMYIAVQTLFTSAMAMRPGQRVVWSCNLRKGIQPISLLVGYDGSVFRNTKSY